MLVVDGVSKAYAKKKVLQNVTFTIAPGESVGLIGMSGSGKSTLARCLMDLERPDEGSMQWYGASLANKRVRQTSRKSIQIVFQDPRNSLNPAWTMKRSLSEAFLQFQAHQSRPQEQDRVYAELLEAVGLNESFLSRYPHELSTGQCQRVCIARALVAEPELIILDECLSALDVSVQAQVIELLHTLHQTRQVSYLFISHDIAVVASLCDRLLVLHEGLIVEQGRTQDILADPKHSYTRSLLADVPHYPKFT
ncbi:ABC transporter ATP-binding protein [Paenibacillus sp. HWE-109]|uniref:ABC transporter ATP-binding protein n=1 Tax=Paenibacillus sp. HWE-109 TaxID=1306526 RepID=UPI001EDFBBA3|nr:ABC transporter ATP-binding protein [Paenibacillus sp. HWE-109]UKS27682.1 ABC transporter ATP-binding protein [Paenibacillus sp. HWE-109]